MSPTSGASLGGIEVLFMAAHQGVHALIRMAEVELLLGLREAERIGARQAADGPFTGPDLMGQGVDLALVEAGMA